MSATELSSDDNYRDEIPVNTTELYDYLLSENCKPSIAAASVTYLYGLLSNQKASQAVIAEYFDTTPSSISKWYQFLWDHKNEWSINRLYTNSGLLEELPSVQRTGPHNESETSKKQLVSDVRRCTDYGNLMPDSDNLICDDLVELTGVRDVMQQKEVLEEMFGLEFGVGEDATLCIMTNKSGVEKIRDKLQSDNA